VIREYADNDFQACEDLVGRTWQFSEHFRPAGFCDVAKYGYTRSSVAGSNFKRVVESDGRVVGFLFGCNTRKPVGFGPLRQMLLSFGTLRRLVYVRGLRPGEKLAFLRTVNQHETNRGKVEKRGASEINLFALEQGFQRQGLGRQLVTQFLDDCRRHGVRRVIVEVNVSQASGIYEVDLPLVRLDNRGVPYPRVSESGILDSRSFYGRRRRRSLRQTLTIRTDSRSLR